MTLQMMNKAKRKRNVKPDKQDDHSDDHISCKVKVSKNVIKSEVKEEISAEVCSTAAGIGTVSNRNQKRKQAVTKRKRSSSAVDYDGSVQKQVDSKVKKDTLLSRNRKPAMTSPQNDERLQQEKHASQSVNKGRYMKKKRHPTRTIKPTSEVQRKKCEEEQSETAVKQTAGKKRTKVKRELSPASAVETVNKTSIKMKQTHMACSSPRQHTCRKFIGAHFSISGMLKCIYISRMLNHKQRPQASSSHSGQCISLARFLCGIRTIKYCKNEVLILYKLKKLEPVFTMFHTLQNACIVGLHFSCNTHTYFYNSVRKTLQLEAFSAVNLRLGGLWNAILSTIEIGGSAFGLFLRSQRTWHCKPLDDNDADLFKKTLKVTLLSVRHS